MSWTFGDETGSMIGGGIFVFTFGIGWVGLEATHRLLNMGSRGLGNPVGRQSGMILSVVGGLAVFALFYFSALSGFMKPEYSDGQLIPEYILPAPNGVSAIFRSDECSGGVGWQRALAIGGVHRYGGGVRERIGVTSRCAAGCRVAWATDAAHGSFQQ